MTWWKHWKQKLETSNLYMRLRYSRPVFNMWLLLRRDVRQKQQAFESVCECLLPPHSQLIFDIGANEGMSASFFLQKANRVIAVEPSSRNMRILKARFGNNKRTTLLSTAISDTEGTAVFYADTSDYAMGTLSRKWTALKNKDHETESVKTATLDHLISLYGIPDYIKIDVEGSELTVVKGLSVPVPLLSFEAILPDFKDETLACIQQLLLLSPDALFNYHDGERVYFPQFVAADNIENVVVNGQRTIDIFCRMPLNPASDTEGAKANG